MIFQIHNCFANHLATKAPIFMKFQTFIYNIVKNYQKFFGKDPSTNTPTGGVNVRARAFRRDKTRAHVQPSCARVCARIFIKNLVNILFHLMNIRLKFHKEWSFRQGDICKTILTFRNHQFSMYFAYIHSYAPQKP